MARLPQKIKTNQQLIKHLMDFSAFGAMGEMFIVDAIRKHAKAVAATTPDHPAYKECGMIHIPSWIGTAKDIHEKCEEFYSGK